MQQRYVVIMAGGLGTRFWPISTSQMPKQFLDVLGVGRSLLQQTYDRIAPLFQPEHIFVSTHSSHQALVKAQLPHLPLHQIICEPYRKNTAPGIAFAANKLHALNPHATALFLPSDHLVLNNEAFQAAVSSCFESAETQPGLYTIGITPHRPDTGYGYIQFRKHTAESKMHQVKTFTEKPNAELAQSFLDSGDFLWNAGIFVWGLNTILQALALHDTELYNLFNTSEHVYNTPLETAFAERAFAASKNLSIDYSVLEKAQNVWVCKSDFGWSDLGTWGSLYEQLKKDENQNVVSGKHILLYDCKNAFIQIPKDKIAVVQGLNNVIVVEKDNVLLICSKDQEQMIRTFVNDVKVKKGERYV